MKKSLFLFAALLAGVFILAAPQKAHALSGSEFQAGHIIDDGVFFNANSMDAASIQIFLNSKVPTCDTNGAQMRGNVTRAAYGASQGYPGPYTCLRDYTQNTPNMPAEAGLCNQYNGGAKSAAKIIFDVAQACGVSPKILLILLEKEQSLVTDDWPWANQYEKATGYFCTDSAPCDPEYAGFFRQVYYGARQYKKYARDASSFGYRAGRTNYIQYNPNAACGGTNVFIQNQATAGLYNYTPYQPNPSALANLRGSGDSCGAYGNRNFWRLYNDWFGSTYAQNCVFPPPVAHGVYRLYNRGTGNQLLTTDASEVCSATSIGYVYDGQLFNDESGTGKPVFRLEAGGRYLFTDSVSERDAAVNRYGYRLEGVAFNGVDPAVNPSAARPVYRVVSNIGTYLYTISPYERDSYVRMGYRYEGVGFYIKENPGASVISTYRLSSPSGAYLFTTSANERDNATQYYGYRYEGVGFNAITQLNSNSMPVYRLATNNGYLFTTNLAERINAINLGYRDEGISMYTYGTVNDPGLKNVYRLSRSGSYFYTTSTAERDSAAQNYQFRLEGIGFQTP